MNMSQLLQVQFNQGTSSSASSPSNRLQNLNNKSTTCTSNQPSPSGPPENLNLNSPCPSSPGMLGSPPPGGTLSPGSGGGGPSSPQGMPIPNQQQQHHHNQQQQQLRRHHMIFTDAQNLGSGGGGMLFNNSASQGQGLHHGPIHWGSGGSGNVLFTTSGSGGSSAGMVPLALPLNLPQNFGLGLNLGGLGQGTMWNVNIEPGIEAMDLGDGDGDYSESPGQYSSSSKFTNVMDDDDIFKVERNDLLGPTLAELNAPDADTLLDGLNFDDLYWPQDPNGPTGGGGPGGGPLDPSPSPQTPGQSGGGSCLDPEDSICGIGIGFGNFGQGSGGGLGPNSSSSFPLGSGSGIGSHHLHHHGLSRQLGLGHSLGPGGSTSVPVQCQQSPIFLGTSSGTGEFHPTQLPTTTTSSSSGGGGGLRELLLRRELQNSMDSQGGGGSGRTESIGVGSSGGSSGDPSLILGSSLPRSMLCPSPGSLSPRLSSSAPSGAHGIGGSGTSWADAWQQRREAVWSRRDPRPHLLSTGSLVEGATGGGGGSTSSLISADVLSPGREFSLSMDEGFDSDELSERDSSDEESDIGSDVESNAGSSSGAHHHGGGTGGSGSSRRERYFWQYNVQAKGPKGQRLVLAPTQEDPHILQRPTDPVFSPLCHIQGIKHSGKARKGDGNDLTPNPKKLFTIGKELDRLNKTIAEMTPVADVPNAIKSRSRKEKNKLASRACRLKKKAQHEANKLKLYGLEQEHKRLISCIEQARIAVFQRMDSSSSSSTPTDLNPNLPGSSAQAQAAAAAQAESLSAKIERISKLTTRQKIGGHTTEFVNRVLDKVKQGVPDGGIGDL